MQAAPNKIGCLKVRFLVNANLELPPSELMDWLAVLSGNCGLYAQ